MLNWLDEDIFRFKPALVQVNPYRPKQENGTDCGVFVCKYMDDLLNDIKCPDRWCPKDIYVFRTRIAYEICQEIGR